MSRKHSRQRDMIKAFLTGRRDHPTADVVYTNVRQQYPNISLGTVYRNLSLLTEMGEIRRLCVGDGVDHFDADTSPHCHFICRECGALSDVHMPDMDSLVEIADAGFDGKIDGNVTYFYGVCAGCLEAMPST